MSLDQGKMMIAYDRKRTSTLTLDEQPGAHTGNVRQYIPGYSDSNIVYLDTVSGNDANGGSTELLAKLTYASAATAAGTTKKIRVINNGAALSTNITKPTEMKRGVSGTISSSTSAPVNTWTQAATPSFSTSIISSCIYSKVLKKYVAGGGSGKIATSTDGDTWTQVASTGFSTSRVFAVFDAPNLGAVFAGGEGGKLAYTTDGVTWNHFTPFIDTSDTILCGLSNPFYSLFCTGQGRIFYTSDNITWTEAASTFTGYDDLIQSVAYGDGLYVFVTNQGSIGYSSDAKIWTQAATPSFSTTTIYAIAYAPKTQRAIAVGDSGKIAYSTAFANTVSADIAGFTVQAVQYSGTVTAYNCTMKQPGTTANLSLNGCRVTEPDAHISSNTQKHTATLFEHDFHMTCTPAAQNDIQVNKCTFGESLYIYNASATAYEQVRDNIIEGGIKADFNVTVSGRDNIRGTSTNLLRGASVTSGDPKFASETDYTLQFQSNGYPRNSLAAGRSAIYFNSAGDARDIGAWSYVESAISYYYAKNSYINKGQDITVTIEETVSEQQGDNGPVSVYTNVNRIKEVLTIQYGSTDDTDRAIFDYIRTLTDKGVKIQLDPEFSSNGSTVTVNGNQSAGVEFLTVDSVATFNGMFLTISDKRYWVMRASPSASAATKLILDRPLEDAVTDNQVITTNYPSGAGEYQFSPPPQLALKRKDNSGLLTWKEGLVLRFVREWSA